MNALKNTREDLTFFSFLLPPNYTTFDQSLIIKLSTMTKLFELKKLQTDFPNVKLTGSIDTADFIRQFYNDDIEIFESFYILLLNINLQTIGYAKISQGGITSTVVDVRIVAKYAIDALATSVVLAHNHPSGNTMPSEADKALTDKLKKGLALLDVTVLDHIILTKDSHYSFAVEGIL